MASFTNQAQLIYNNTVTNSNVAVGEIVEVLSATKTAVPENYRRNSDVTYVINIVNTGNVPYTSLSVTDNLGAYNVGDTTYYPLTYAEGSVVYFVNGVERPAPAVTATETSLLFSGIDVPAGGNATIIYNTTVNAFAPFAEGSEITNTAVVNGNGITTPLTVSETVGVAAEPSLTITKSISPVPVTENGILTYKFLIQNFGNTAVAASDNAVLTDTFDPLLNGISVTFNGELWTEGTNYTYNTETGLLETIGGSIIVPAAAFTQNTDGTYSVTPGTATLVVVGNL